MIFKKSKIGGEGKIFVIKKLVKFFKQYRMRLHERRGGI